MTPSLSLSPSSPPNCQLNTLQGNVTTAVIVDAAFLITDLSKKESKAHVDVTLHGPDGKEIYSKKGVSDDHLSVSTTGTRGPYKLCWRMTRSNVFVRPSVLIDLKFFTINVRCLLNSIHSSCNFNLFLTV